MKRTWFAIGVLALAANCESSLEPARQTGPATTAQTTGAALALRDHARSHLQAATSLQLAISHGRLTDVRDIATWFSTHPLSRELSRAAYQVERAPDLAAAAVHSGEIARACSNCHEASGAQVQLHADWLPTDDKTLHAQMHRHQWAAARLWHGLVGPSDDAWAEGARVLATTPMTVRETVHEVPNVAVFELAETMQAQAARAGEVRDHDERAKLYGELMQTCTRCHDATRMEPTPGGAPAPLVSKR